MGNELTSREKEVLCYLGYSYEEIGEMLFISAGTVKSHVQKIMKKLEVKSRIHALVKAVQQGIITIEEIVL